MGSRVLMGIVLFVSLAVATAFFIISVLFLKEQILALLPQAAALAIEAPLQGLLTGQVIALFVLALVLSAAVYMTLNVYITRPLRHLGKAIQKYTDTGERTAVEGIQDAPQEMQSIASSFDALLVRIDDSHKRDVEISRVKSDFISTAAHQLRTPLTGIRWALEALAKEPLAESQKLLVQSAVDKSKDLVTIVGTLLDISAIESGKFKYTFEPVDMHKVLEEIISTFAPFAQTSKVSLFYAHENQADMPSVTADRERIKWVLNNLVENAITYTPSGGTVRLSIDVSDRLVFVRVKDTGIGIEAKDHANIFERFYRAGNAITKQNKGNGLGLYIARTIAVDHKGDLSFMSNTEGPGTTFTLSLPRADVMQ